MAWLNASSYGFLKPKVKHMQHVAITWMKGATLILLSEFY